ncbi:MAG: hypothetical protein Satyrvirus9_21 [Satyrvirus sp.]|uniref:Uncharacterized protein n=1 Tax=Satyrvirus sp. TaxID=2487771 RepID=A0A3G5ADJ8_9VIRU|nr:MAG: hypothetical protein Satyrvirus9_21 [Satyrvirus sp.]
MNSKSKKKINNFGYVDDLVDVHSDGVRKKKNKYAKKNLLDVSEQITNNIDSIHKILDTNGAQKPEYLSQFNIQTFDSDGLPSALNDTYQTNDKVKLADLERKLSYQGGWSQYDQDGSMDYGVVPENELSHENMFPSFKIKQGYGSNDNTSFMDYKNGLFTGNQNGVWKKKEEVGPLFAPLKDLFNMYGNSINTDEQKSRIVTSMYRQNEKPFDDVKITPGLNLDYNENGTDGFHPMYRCFDKTIDEIRVKPKITYEGRIVEGKKGDNRPIQAPVVTNRPHIFKTMVEDDLLPTHDLADGPKIRQNFIMKEPDKSKQHIEYTGGAYTKEGAIEKNIPEYMREKYKESDRQNFTLPEPLQKFSKEETKFNSNTKSYNLSPTMKDQIIENGHMGVTGVPATSIYTGLSDLANPTTKETIISQYAQYAHGNVAPNTLRGIVHSVDIADPTLKEVSIENKLNPHAPNLNTMQRVYYPDLAKETIKEITAEEPIVPSNILQNSKIYANWTDPAKYTTKETTSQIPYQMVVMPNLYSQKTPLQDTPMSTTKEITIQIPYKNVIVPVGQYQRAPNPVGLMNCTTKETTATIPYKNVVTPIYQQQRAPNIQNNLQNTMKEINIEIPQNNFITPIDQQRGKFNLVDPAKQTMKEIVIQIPYKSVVTPVGQQQRAPDLQDISRTTTKETSSSIPYQTIIDPVGQQQRAPDPQNIFRGTTKEITIQIPYNNILTSVGQEQRAPNFSNFLRTTSKETTSQSPYQNMVTPDSKGFTTNPQDIAKTTKKEITVQIPNQTILAPVEQYQGPAGTKTMAKPTIKEIVSQIPYNSNITAINQQQGKVSNMDPERTTNRESLVQIPYNTHTTAVGQYQRTPNPHDILKTTTKESMLQIPYGSNISTVVQQRTPNLKDAARPTNKECTIQIPYGLKIQSTNKSVGKVFDGNPAKMTTKETIVENENILGPTFNTYGKGYGYMAGNFYVPNTNKEISCQEVYIHPLAGNIKNRPYDDAYNATLDDRKEILQQYRAPTTCGPDIGPDPLRVNIQLKNDNNKSNKSREPMVGFSYNSSLDRPKNQIYSRQHDTVSEERFIDPILLEQLNSNPFNIPIC